MTLSPSRRIFLAFACVILLLGAQGAATVLSMRYTLAEIRRLNHVRDDAQRMATVLNRTQTEIAILAGSRNPAVMDGYRTRYRADWHELEGLAVTLRRELPDASGIDPGALARLGESWARTGDLQYQFAFELAQQNLAATVPLYEKVADQVARCFDAAEHNKAAALDRASNRALDLALGLGLLAIGIALFWAWYLQRIFIDRKRAEASLATALHRLELVLESASQVAIIMTDPKGLVQIFNRGAENLTGWSADEVVNLRTPILLHDPEEIERERQGLASEGAAPADPFEALVARARNGAAHRRKWTLVTRQGGRRCLDLVITRVDDLAGHSLGFLGVGIDVTREEEAAEALRRKEEQLRHSQKMDAIGQLAGGVAHDFNNMLAGILGSTELLAASLEPGDSRAKLVKLIATASQRASDLTSKLLSFSRKGKLVSTPFSVHRIIQETLQLVQRSIGPRISIQLDLAPGEPTIVGDPSEIESALLNLCINARDAMPEGGTLTIGTALVERDGLPTLRLRVADTGTGIPEPIRQRIFEPFFTTKAQGKGTGLGLAAVYGIVQAHGGFLDLETEPGRGTAFLLDFPLDSRGAAPDPGLPGPGPTGSGTVLVVDDEDVVRATSSMLLESAGYQVILAKDGEEALRLYQDHAGRVALVLMDMIMPGIPGREAAQRIRAMDPNARFLFTSGFAGPGMMPETQASGIAGFLHKPFTRHDLLEAVARALA